MAILLTNDDGADAPGLAALAEALAGLDDLYIVAPASNQSGVGMGISIYRDLEAKKLPDGPGGIPRHSLSGTPADAVKYGLQHILADKPPRLVVSGINLGPNLGRNIRCSGTVGAAAEAVIDGFPALAVSVGYVIPTDWSGAKHYARLVAEKALKMIDEGEKIFLLNLNVPSAPPEKIPGMVTARQGIGGIHDILSVRSAEDNSYFMEGEWVHVPPENDCDMIAFSEGYAVITPMQLDMTHHAFMAELRRKWKDDLIER